MTGTEIAFRLGPGTLAEARRIAERLASRAGGAVEHVLFCDADAGEYGCLAVWPGDGEARAYVEHPGVMAELAALGARTGRPTRVRVYGMEYQRRAADRGVTAP